MKFKAQITDDGDLEIVEEASGSMIDGWYDAKKDALKALRRTLMDELNETIDSLTFLRNAVLEIDEMKDKLP